jgi:hypothetical protein
MLPGKSLYSADADNVFNKKIITASDLESSFRELRSIPLPISSLGNSAAFLNSITASVTDLTNNNQNIGKKASVLKPPVANRRLFRLRSADP